MGNVHMEASQINYRGGEKKMSVEEAIKNTSGEAAAIAQLQADVLNLNSNKANQITIAPFFSAEASYDPGDLVYYNGLTYRCVNAHEGEWDADDFVATTISNEMDALRSGLTSLIKTQTVRLTGITLAPLGYNGDIVPITVPTGYTLLSLTVSTVGAYTSYCTFYFTESGKLQVSNLHPTETAIIDANITLMWCKTSLLS